MPNVTTFHLYAHTRDEPVAENAGSDDNLRLFADGEEIARFDPPPPRGKSKRLMAVDIKYDYDLLISRPLHLGLTGDDRWSPRSAFLVGVVEGLGLRPLAQNLRPRPTVHVSQDVGEGVDRWPLTNIAHANIDAPLRDLVIAAKTGPQEWAGSPGPLELTVFAEAAGIPVIVYQTILARAGLQEPAEPDGWYYAHLPVHSKRSFTAAQIAGAQLSVRSDNAWYATSVSLWGLNDTLTSGRLLCEETPVNVLGKMVSQDPHDGPGNQPALDAIELSPYLTDD
jgi:hypothetical protein